MFPATITQFVQIQWLSAFFNKYMHSGSLLYYLFYVGFIFFFCYFYTAVTFNPVDVADNMKKYGGYIPGIRPGKRTADYIGLRPTHYFDHSFQRVFLFRRNILVDRSRSGH
jgi:preprotein translocase subunit SecY